MKAGLATKEQAEQAERAVKIKKEAEEKKALKESYSKNRLGRTVAYAAWFIDKRKPKDIDRVCCLCGHNGPTGAEAVESIFSVGQHAKGFMESSAQMMRKAKELKLAGVVLLQFDLARYLREQTHQTVGDFFENASTKVCQSCLKHECELFGSPTEES